MITWILERTLDLVAGVWEMAKFFAPGIALWLVIMITWALFLSWFMA